MKIASRRNLRVILRNNGEFAAWKRISMWRYALCLPFNKTAYESLTKKGTHSHFIQMPLQYKFLSSSKQFHLTRLSSNLAHWMPIFTYIKYFPVVFLRFINVFKNCPISSFEAVATIIVNYCQHWFEDIPFAPKRVSEAIEEVIKKKDPALVNHLEKCGMRVSTIGWGLLETLFSEVLDEQSWYILWDNIILHHPKFMYMVAVAFIILNKNILLQSRNINYFKMIHKQSKINVKDLINLALVYTRSENLDIHLEPFTPLEEGDVYKSPTFQYPQIIIQYQEYDYVDIKKTEANLLKEEIQAKGRLCAQEGHLKFIELSKGDLKLRKERLKLYEHVVRNCCD